MWLKKSLLHDFRQHCITGKTSLQILFLFFFVQSCLSLLQVDLFFRRCFFSWCWLNVCVSYERKIFGFLNLPSLFLSFFPSFIPFCCCWCWYSACCGSSSRFLTRREREAVLGVWSWRSCLSCKRIRERERRRKIFWFDQRRFPSLSCSSRRNVWLLFSLVVNKRE